MSRLLLLAAVAVIGCSSETTKPPATTPRPADKMGDKMKDDKMGDGKMGDGKMSGDKMGDGKMSGDKMGTSPTGK